MYLLAVAGCIACKDAGLFEAFSCPWTPLSTFDKLREIERPRQRVSGVTSVASAFRRLRLGGWASAARRRRSVSVSGADDH